MIKGIFFDVGGTLYSYRNVPAAMKSLLEMTAKRLELSHDIDELQREFSLANKETDKVFSEKSFFLGRDYIVDTFTRFLDPLLDHVPCPPTRVAPHSFSTASMGIM